MLFLIIYLNYLTIDYHVNLSLRENGGSWKNELFLISIIAAGVIEQGYFVVIKICYSYHSRFFILIVNFTGI